VSRDRRLVPGRFWVHLCAAAVLAVLLVWDRPIYEAIRGVNGPFLDALTTVVSRLRGATFPILVALVLVLWGLLRGRSKIRRVGLALLLVAVLSGAVATVLKVAIARPGPRPPPSVLMGGLAMKARYSRFPSTHAAVMFGSATALAAFYPAAAVPAYGLALLVSHERIYRATHFPSDIFAGAWLGIVLAQVIVAWCARRETWRACLSRAWLERIDGGPPEAAADVEPLGLSPEEGP
jgi:membrane-associated phospholipid phosphatase